MDKEQVNQVRQSASTISQLAEYLYTEPEDSELIPTIKQDFREALGILVQQGEELMK